MRPMGQKQSSTQADWVQARINIERLVSREELDERISRTVDEVIKVSKGRTVAFGWSGGKDSIALEHVMRLAGVRGCLIGVTNLEYPAFMKWVLENPPPDLQIINTGQDLSWLAENQHMLFPRDSKTAAKWFRMIQHTAQEQYYQEHDLDLIILGRRKKDGNHIPYNEDGHPIYTNARGITRYSPLAEWTHEEVLALMHYYETPEPPIYSWPRGYQVGTGAWPARQGTRDDSHGWSEVYSIDPSVVREAATVIEGAAKFLEGVA